ncbi:MAG: murein biosynthesis integral membrane protein MurJ [Chloroflexi bacterium]|nr:murein biosynthesis integral membrane protein MurJ [Chloroflexota bacterium]
MGVAQASDILEPLRLLVPSWRWRLAVPQLRRIHLATLLTRELTIAEAAFVLMASFFLSALLGAVRQVLFNAQFGAGTEANAYYAAFRLPDTLFSLIAGGALSSAMIPVLLSTTRDEGEQAGWRLVNLVLTTLLAVFALVVLLGEVFTPIFIIELLAPGFDAETSRLTVTLTRIMLIQPVILAVGSVATAVLNSRNRFVLTALSVVSHNVALIAGIGAAAAFPELGIYGPTFGVIGGAVLQAAILLPGLLSGELHYRPGWDLGNPRLREVVRLLIPNGLAVGVNYAGFILDTSFASMASEQAALPAITNAWLLVGLPIALLGQAVGQSAFPRLAAHAAALEWHHMRRTLLQALGAGVALTIPALAGLLVLGRITITILFEHGKFDAAAGSLTYAVLVPYAVGLPFYVGTEVITRGLIALRDTRTPLLTNTVQLVGRGAIMALLVGSLGVIAIPIAFAVTASAETIMLGTVLLFKLRHAGRAVESRIEPAMNVAS